MSRNSESCKFLSNWRLESKISVCAPDADNYPHFLLASMNVPPILYYQGDINILGQQKILAIVGGRDISDKGKVLSYNAGKKAAMNSFVVVNGLAIGCDCAALKGALENGGKCVAILPCGLDQIVLRCNYYIADMILKTGGCLISEYPEGIRPSRYSYIEHDRLQSGVSKGVLVIETRKSGGTMHTVNFAKKQKKKLACYYGQIIGFSKGNQSLGESEGVTRLEEDSDLDIFLNNLEKEFFYQQMILDI